MNDVMLIVKQYNCSIIQQDTQLFCYMQLGIPKVKKNEVLFKLNDLQGVEITAL